MVVLDPDVARLFPNREAINETLRAVAEIVNIQFKSGEGTGLTKGWSEREKRVAQPNVFKCFGKTYL